MNRRRFMQVTGLAGLAVMAPIALREGRADAGTYGGPYWITVDAGGGWDPTLLCDPKGGILDDRTTVNQTFTKGEIVPIGKFQVAPTVYNADGVDIQSAPAFFTKHGGRIMVVNGLDTTTNNHDAGSRITWSGLLGEGYPSLAAMVAGQVAAGLSLPMAYLSNGGYDATGGLIPLTRIGSTDDVQRLAYPNRRDPSDPMSETYHTNETASRIAKVQAERVQALRDKASLPTIRSGTNALYLAREGNGGLVTLGEALQGLQQVQKDDFPDLVPVNNGNVDEFIRIARQAQLALYAFKAGVAVSANLAIGGFDTHGNHDNNHIPQIMQLVRGLSYLFDQIDAMGLKDKVYVLVGSDFGRTPYYNEGNGKDHWNITSMLLSGPSIPGGKLVGSTDDGFKPKTVDPKTLAESASGIRIEPKHIHKALRKVAGLTGTEIDKAYPLAGEDLPLFV